MNIVAKDHLIAYDDIGKGHPVIILHGWGHNRKLWQTITSQLVAEGKRVIVIDLPGFGDSPAPKKPLEVYDYANIISDLISKIGIESYSLIGHSMGGRIGIILASKTGHNPPKNLILVDSAGIHQPSWRVRVKIFCYKKIYKPLQKLLPLYIKNLFESSDYRNSGTLRETFVKVVNEDLRYLLPKIRTETLIIWGENDEVLPVWHGQLMKSEITSSTLRIVWGSGHNPHLSDPKQLLEIISEYI